MGNYSPEEVVQAIELTEGDYLDTFESFRGPLWENDGLLAIALANVLVLGPVINGMKENWIDKGVLVAKGIVRLDPRVLHSESFIVGGTGVDPADLSGEVEFQSANVRLLLFPDSAVLRANPNLSLSEAERFICAVDVSNRDWFSCFS